MDLMDDSSVNFWTMLFFIFCQIFAIFQSGMRTEDLEKLLKMAKNEENRFFVFHYSFFTEKRKMKTL